MTPSDPCVRLERPREGVALVTVTNPAIHNHVSWSAVEQLADALRAAREGGARVTVLASGVPGHWLEHAWLPDLLAMLRGQPASGDGAAWFRALAELAREPVVTIAALAGDASGGGAELAWACDLRVAEDGVAIGQPEVQIGLTTGVGGTSRLLRLVGRSAAAEMVLDGAPLSARRLHALGAINRLVGPGEAKPAALAWAARLAARPPHALAALKALLVEAEERPLSEALAEEQRRFQAVARRPEALAGMERAQARLDAGASPRAVYGEPAS